MIGRMSHPGGSQSIFIKGHGGTNTENISKREVNYQMCSTPIILATAVSTLPWTLLHESHNLGRFHSCIFCCQRDLLPPIQKQFPFLCICSLRAINSPLHSRGEGGYRNHPLCIRKSFPTVPKSLSKALPVSYPQVSLQLGFTIELFHAHSVRARHTSRSRPSTEPLTSV